MPNTELRPDPDPAPDPAGAQTTVRPDATPYDRFAFFAAWPGRLARALPIVLAVLVLVFILVQIRPWEKADTGMTDNLAEAWNGSIKRLGIEPLFPPQEDFNVGDIWAVIATYAETPGEPRELNPSDSIVGKGVRIGRIELAKLGVSNGVRPVFPLTRKDADGEIVYDNTAPAEPAVRPKNGIELSYISFPSFAITTSSADSGSVSSLLGLSASRGRGSTEIIKIPIAETYSAPAATAIVAITRWCAAPENLGMCTDETVRDIVAYALQNKVYEVLDGKYRYGLEIKLVTQTFMTRQIDFQRLAEATLTTELGDGAGGSGSDATPMIAANKPSTQNRLGLSGSVTINFGIDSVIYPRPVVFGFRAISVALDASVSKER